MAKRGPFEGSSQSSASAEAIWAIWTDPAVWQGGVIASASIDREFALGAKITVRVKGYMPQTSTVTNIDALRMWTGVAKAPGLTLTYDHLIESTETGTVITERATMSGPLAGITGLLLGDRLAKTFNATTAHTARLAEARV